MRHTLEDLQLSLDEQKALLKARETAKPIARQMLRKAEQELKLAKRAYNHLIIDVRENKKRIKRLKNAISSFPRRLRIWTESHVGDLIDKASYQDELDKLITYLPQEKSNGE